MEGWKDIKLKELLEDIGDGGTPSTIDSTNFGGEIAWAVVEDVLPNIYYTNECLTEKGYTSCSAKKWPKGSIILTTGATIGLVGITHIELCTKQGITGMIPNKYANNYFLRYWFEANIKQLLRYAQGTTFKEIRPRTLSNLKISIPNPFTDKGFDEQKAIATILSKVDEAIETTKQSINAAEKLKKAMMQNLLTGKLKPDGTWRKEEDFYIDEKFGKIPKGWIIQKGNKLTTKITKGQSPKWQGFEYQDEGILFVTSENVQNGFIDLKEPKYLPIEFNNKIKNSQLHKGDILINIVGASIGRCSLFDLDVDLANTNQAVCVFRLNDSNNPDFFSFYFQNESTQRRLLGSQVETARANLSLGDFRKFKFIIPESKNEQIHIANKLNEVKEIITSKHNKIKSLEKLKKSLMQHLLTGKKRLPKEAIEKINQN